MADAAQDEATIGDRWQVSCLEKWHCAAVYLLGRFMGSAMRGCGPQSDRMMPGSDHGWGC